MLICSRLILTPCLVLFVLSSFLAAEEMPLQTVQAAPTTVEQLEPRKLALIQHLSLGLDPEILDQGLLGSSLLNSPADISKDGLKLIEAIRISIERNPEFAADRLITLDAQQELQLSKSSLDTVFRTYAERGRARTPASARFSGVELTDQLERYGVELSQLTAVGTSFALSIEESRSESSSDFNLYSPLWSDQARLTISQPLLQGFSWGMPLIKIRAQKKLTERADYQYRAKLADHILRVSEIYWAQSLAMEQVKVKERALALTERLLRDTQESVKVGLQASLLLSEASLKNALRREELIVAQNELEKASRALYQILGIELYSGALLNLKLLDKPKFIELGFSSQESIQVALENRAELKAQLLAVDSARLTTTFASNLLLPKLNLNGSIASIGQAGRLREGSDQDQNLQDFSGARSESRDLLGSGDYYDFTVGLSIEYPIENRAARARYNIEQLGLSKARLTLAEIKQQIAREVLDSLSDLEASKKRYQAAQEAVKFSNESLDAANERLKVGLSTLREVLEVQEDLAQAESNMVQALVDHELALDRIYRARGELLERYAIKVD